MATTPQFALAVDKQKQAAKNDEATKQVKDNPEQILAEIDKINNQIEAAIKAASPFREIKEYKEYEEDLQTETMLRLTYQERVEMLARCEKNAEKCRADMERVKAAMERIKANMERIKAESPNVENSVTGSAAKDKLETQVMDSAPFKIRAMGMDIGSDFVNNCQDIYKKSMETASYIRDGKLIEHAKAKWDEIKDKLSRNNKGQALFDQMTEISTKPVLALRDQKRLLIAKVKNAPEAQADRAKEILGFR